MEMGMILRTVLFTGGQAIIAVSGLLIISGLVFIKWGQKEYHKRSMIAAAFFALIFVVFYLVRAALFPHAKYTGDYRSLYLFILFSHTLLAVVNGPLAVVTIHRALKGDFDRHKRIAPYTAGIWIYVAATGWSIFAFTG